MKENQPIKIDPCMKDWNKSFVPCLYCSHAFSVKCTTECAPDQRYKDFDLLPGTSIKDLPPYPMHDILRTSDHSYRIVTPSIYLSVITDYLQNSEESKHVEETPEKENQWPKNFKLDG
jgi:hypothetical protein